MSQAIIPPFNLETAKAKVKRAEDLWNGKEPEKVALAYTENSQWRNRSEFVQGRKEIAQLLTRKWERELQYKLKKELFTFADNRIAVHFQYEYCDNKGQWFRAYGNEHWDFDSNGLMQTRDASINELEIKESERQIF